MPDIFTHWWFWLVTVLSSLATSFGLAMAMVRAKRKRDPFTPDSENGDSL